MESGNGVQHVRIAAIMEPLTPSPWGNRMASRAEVGGFLREFKAAVTLGFVHWIRRQDEKKAHLSGLEITRNQALEHLLGLTPGNYCKGPEPDDFEPDREIWIFGFEVEGTEAYLKLALAPDRRRRTVTNALIWSFHAAEYPLDYPLRES